MIEGVCVVGAAMTDLHRRDQPVEAMACEAARAALADASLRPGDVGLVVASNALGGRLNDQGCIRGQSWLRSIGLQGAPVINVDNSCAGGSSALHMGVLAAVAGESPVLVVGVEKMLTGDRASTLAGIEDGLPAPERAELRATLDNGSGSVLMAMNARWARTQLDARGTRIEEIAAAASRAYRCAARNPKAQHHRTPSPQDVLDSPAVVPPLRRLMCSSFTDGAAAVVVARSPAAGMPRVLASVARSGNGELEYHDRLADTTAEAWKESGVAPADVDVVELHDATSAEELYALESLGFFAPGEAGWATARGRTDVGGDAVTVNPSGGLVARGHPLGATGLCQVVELADQLRGRAGDRQVEGARLAVAVNTGGIIGGDAAMTVVHVLGKD